MISDRLYLYAIVNGVHPLESPLAGLAGTAVSLLPCYDLAAAVSPVMLDAVRPEPEQLLCHERVVEALMVQRSTLPVRFGTVLSGTDQVLATLAERHHTFAADLSRLEDQVEVGVRVLWDAEAVRRTRPEQALPITVARDDRPGTRYLLARAEEQAVERQLRWEAERLEAWCMTRLKPLATDASTQLLMTAAMPVSAVFLTPRTGVTALLEAAAHLQVERPDLQVVCSGPWPPYHFVTK